MSPFPSSIRQEVSHGRQSVFSSSSNLNSPTPQEQSLTNVGADDEDGIKEGGEEIVGGEDAVGTKDGIEVGFMDGADDDVGIEETDGDVDGTRFSSHEMSIINGS